MANDLSKFDKILDSIDGRRADFEELCWGLERKCRDILTLIEEDLSSDLNEVGDLNNDLKDLVKRWRLKQQDPLPLRQLAIPANLLKDGNVYVSGYFQAVEDILDDLCGIIESS